MPLGRPKKPLEQHLKDGTYRPARHGPLPFPAPEDDGPPAPPKKPKGLPKDQAKDWDWLAKVLGPAARERDQVMMAEFCWWMARSRHFKQRVEESDGGKEAKDALILSAICATKIREFSVAFGLTPGDRAKLKIVDAGPVRSRVPSRPRTRLDAMGPPPEFRGDGG